MKKLYMLFLALLLTSCQNLQEQKNVEEEPVPATGDDFDLSRAAWEGEISRVKALLESGVDVNSQMGQHHVVAFDLCGKIDYPLMVSNSHSRGKELPVARQIVEDAANGLKDRFPQLFLLDSLYFNQPFFDCVRCKGAHVLIKSDEPSFREVLVDAKFVFENKNDLVVPVEEKHGFDEFRVCSWRIEKTSGVFVGYPIQIGHLLEDYPKRKKTQHQDCWIVTTDLTLLPEKIRETAHLRWHMENNGFYADIGIKTVMPTVELCRVMELIAPI